MGFVMEAPHRAPEAHVMLSDKFVPMQVSQANAHLPKTPLGKVEVLRFLFQTEIRRLEQLLQ